MNNNYNSLPKKFPTMRRIKKPSGLSGGAIAAILIGVILIIAIIIGLVFYFRRNDANASPPVNKPDVKQPDKTKDPETKDPETKDPETKTTLPTGVNNGDIIGCPDMGIYKVENNKKRWYDAPTFILSGRPKAKTVTKEVCDAIPKGENMKKPLDIDISPRSFTNSLLKNVGTNKCIDYHRNSTDNGAGIVAWGNCHGGDNQRMTHNAFDGRITNKMTDNKHCLVVNADDKNTGSILNHWTCGSHASDHWIYDNLGRLRLEQHPDMCATAFPNLDEIKLSPCGNDPNQFWTATN